MSIKSLQRTTLRDQCLDGLRSAITTGQLPAGQHLVETDLSAACQPWHSARGHASPGKGYWSQVPGASSACAMLMARK